MTSASLEPTLDDRLRLTRRPDGPPVMHQRWEHLLFLHWEVPAATIAPLLPPGMEVDLFEGRAYVGLVPFTMTGVRPRGLPSVPGLSSFHETNVRTYVRTPEGVPGVWFFSLDAAGLVASALGRFWFHLPYFYARMSLDAVARPAGGWMLRYASSRIYPRSPTASAQICAEVTGPVVPAVPGSLEFFLAERYLLYTLGRTASGAAGPPALLRGRVHHSSYPLQEARLVSLDESALAAAGFERPATAPLVHYARRVVVEIFGLESVKGDTGQSRGGADR